MPAGLGVAVITPAPNGGTTVECNGAIAGGQIAQVINLTTGADVTSSYDPYIPAIDTIVQLDSTPSILSTHLVTFSIPGGDAITTKFAVVNSLGTDPGTHGAVTAPSVRVGDTIIRAISPVTNFGYGDPVDLTKSFAPTVTTRATVMQIAPISTADSILLLLRNAGATSVTVDIGISVGTGVGILRVRGAPTGAQVVRALDLTGGRDLTAGFAPIVPVQGRVYQATGPSLSSVALLLFRRPSASS